MNIQDIIEKRIFWHQDKKESTRFYSELNGVKVYLRINNFPEEPLYTVFLGTDSLDIEDKPVKWIIKYN